MKDITSIFNKYVLTVVERLNIINNNPSMNKEVIRKELQENIDIFQQWIEQLEDLQEG